LIKHAFEIFGHNRGIYVYYVERYTKVGGNLMRVRQILRCAFLNSVADPNGEASNVGALTSHSYYSAGVKPTRKKRSDRHIRHKLPMNSATNSILGCVSRLFEIGDLTVGAPSAISRPLPEPTYLTIFRREGAPRR
jgi:hypothetical protein